MNGKLPLPPIPKENTTTEIGESFDPTPESEALEAISADTEGIVEELKRLNNNLENGMKFISELVEKYLPPTAG